MNARTAAGVCAVLVTCGLAAATPASAATPTARECKALRADRTMATRVARDAKKDAPRVFAMQVKLDANQVRTVSSFGAKVECLLREHVLPHRAKGRPNVVVFDENAGILAAASGSRGARARRIASNPQADTKCRGQAFPCRTLNLLAQLGAAYAPQRRYYSPRLGSLAAPSAPFTLATDTIARTFMRSFSDAARRHKIYVVAANMQSPFQQTRARAAVRALAPKGAKSAYAATSSKVYNSVFLWGPRDVRRSGPDVMRNVLASNRKVPLTGIEVGIGLAPGANRGAAARRNLEPFRIPGTKARLGFATSLPAFRYGTPPAGTDPCSNVTEYYMRCLDKLGANVVVQADANPGEWTGPDGDGIEKWQPLSWMTSTWRAVTDAAVGFDYNVTPMLTGNVSDLVFDGQTAITQRGAARGRGCNYIGTTRFDPAEDRPDLTGDAGRKREFLGIAPWVAGDRPRAALRAVQRKLAPGSGDRLENDYVETVVAADLPFPVDRSRRGCAG